MSNTKVGIVIWLTDEKNEKRVLLGNESNYVSDLKDKPSYLETIVPYLNTESLKYFGEPDPTTRPLSLSEKFERIIGELEKVSTDYTTVQEAREVFSSRAKDLTKNLNLGEVRFDQVEGSDGEGGTSHYTVHYRHLLQKPKCGIVKGDKKTGESDVVAIKREVMEEVGIDIDEAKLKSLKICGKCAVYSYYIGNASNKETRDKILKIVETIAARKSEHCGELFGLDFKNKTSVDKRKNNLNQVSKCVIEDFFKEVTSATATASGTSASGTKRGGRTKSKQHKKRRSTRKIR
jgi:predicted NUDIX family NTP pyrophosphohydrolase